MKNKMKEYEDLYSSPATREVARQMGERMAFGSKLSQIFEKFGDELIGKSCTILVPERFGPNFNYGDKLTINYVGQVPTADLIFIDVGFVEVSESYDLLATFAPWTGKIEVLLDTYVEYAEKLKEI